MIDIFITTALQAAASAMLALLFGVAGGLGLLWVQDRSNARDRVSWTTVVSAFALLPSAAPVLLFLLAVAKLAPSVRGLGGVIFTHAMINTGLVAVAFAQSARVLLGGAAELALVEGARRWQFLCVGALPALRNELSLLFLFIFTFSFASFAVPLTIGGSHASTVEVLIFQKLRIEADWASAIWLSIGQIVVLLALSVVMGASGDSRAGTGSAADLLAETSSAPRRLQLLSWAPGLLFALAPSVFLLCGMSGGLVRGARDVLPTFLEDGLRLIAGSTLVGFGVGVFVTLSLMILAYVRPSGWGRRAWRGLTAPSTTLTGFALLFLWRGLGLASFGKIALGLGLLWLPTLFRYRWEAKLTRLEGQVAVARSLGASEWLIFKRVVAPQCWPLALQLGGLASFWAWGDFALSRVVAERTLTVAMAAEEMMGAYRFEGATFTVWLAVLGGLLSYAIFAGAAHVFSEKS